MPFAPASLTETLPHPDDIAGAFVDLALPSCRRNGETVAVLPRVDVSGTTLKNSWATAVLREARGESRWYHRLRDRE